MTPETLAALSGRAYRHMTPWNATQFAETLARPHALLTTTPNAFVLGLVIPDEAEVLALACDPDHQGQGQASRALDTFHRTAADRGAARIFLEVAAANSPARRFYAARGYTEAGLRRAYYARPDGSRDDAVVMTRALP